MSVLLDVGAFLALERNDRAMWLRLKGALAAGDVPVTHGGIIGQVWRGGAGRQARLSQALRSVEVLPLDDDLGRAAGILQAKSATSDVIDAALVALAVDDDVIVSSDPADIDRLVDAAGRHVDIVPA